MEIGGVRFYLGYFKSCASMDDPRAPFLRLPGLSWVVDLRSSGTYSIPVQVIGLLIMTVGLRSSCQNQPYLLGAFLFRRS
jgi:hypothetical protein